MISRIILDDFLSYGHSEIDLSGNVIAVVGDNGSGKSALLESIPYVYYGTCRETSRGLLSRNKGAGGHRAEILNSDGHSIIRGQTSDGKGFCEVRLGDKLISKGEEANTWILDRLGVDEETYLLMAFFGLADSHMDNILRVTPSARLEALQNLAKVGPYKKLHSIAKQNLNYLQKDYDNETSRLKGAESNLYDERELEKGIQAGYKLMGDQSDTLTGLKVERKSLHVEEEKYQAFVKEKERVYVEIKNLKKEIQKLEESKSQLLDDIEENTDTVQTNQNKLGLLREEMNEKYPDSSKYLQKLKDGIQKNKEQITVLGTHRALKEVALQSNTESLVCPLCEQEIDKDIVSSWKGAVKELATEIASIEQRVVSTGKDVVLIENMSDELATLDDDTAQLIHAIEKDKSELEEIERDLSRISGELAKKNSRVVDLSEKLGDEYEGLQKRIETNNDSIEVTIATLNEAKGKMTQLKKAMEHNKKGLLIIKDAKANAKRLKSKIAAATLLQSAWNRYGIPLQLVSEMCSDIEDRASAVYQEFDNGYIEVREVEDRGKPGIQFVLTDKKGERTFRQLSLGEKVMFFISIRVAIAQIVSYGQHIEVDHIILDEAMGNLSPGRRDDLVRLINKTLRKLFPQVIMVSHTEMRDIFSQTLKISAENGVSSIEIA
jgi:DNA repair protein SbcC/Rad50